MARFAVWLHDRLMAMAERLTRYTVVLSWDAPIQWPNECLKCGEHLPDRTWPVRLARTSHWSIVAGFEPPWRRQRINVPVCAACHRRAFRKTWFGRIIPFIVLITILLGGLALARLLVPTWPVAGRIVQVAAVIGSIVIGVIIGVSIGAPFDISSEKHNTLHFTFKSRERAQALAVANGTDVIEPEPLPTESDEAGSADT